jgi:hypothetical protein
LFGSGNFRGERRLTGFRGARKIIRIRTKRPAASNVKFSTPVDHAAKHFLLPFDSLTLACELVHAD